MMTQNLRWSLASLVAGFVLASGSTVRAQGYYGTPQGSAQSSPQSIAYPTSCFCPFPQGYCPIPQAYCGNVAQPLGVPRPYVASPQSTPQGYYSSAQNVVYSTQAPAYTSTRAVAPAAPCAPCAR